MYLNSIVPESGLLVPSLGMFGLKGAHCTKARARSWSVTCGGRPEMYNKGSCRYGCGSRAVKSVIEGYSVAIAVIVALDGRPEVRWIPSLRCTEEKDQSQEWRRLWNSRMVRVKSGNDGIPL
jgi:hypothetical protein